MNIPVFGQKIEGAVYKQRRTAYGVIFSPNEESVAVIRTPKGIFLPVITGKRC
ncbi:hypothetical protein [Mechercharimyces sp. CAU 1602]|uniref:hypothetical protein n=1 Tax=Mechercharimyces sp. CAU 1602 TaxID=2973933 RepID=UPI00216388EC|nr:hypothetical protein [Mechercharimyces sp. CAU 1602]MCS1351035.1 hypothetical protein [Mechercharimyces sp. CAU 1602]